MNKIKKALQWLKHRISHKISHISWSSLKDTLKKHGLALVVIIVLWEIIEDILFPALFIFLGNTVHPTFYAGAPAAWILCLHWLAVPLMWRVWIKLKGKEKDV